MDKITVAELATECSVQNQVVFSELKRLGLYVGSPTATIDASFADTIRKKILAQRDAEEARALEADKEEGGSGRSRQESRKEGSAEESRRSRARRNRSRRLKQPARRRSRRKRPRKTIEVKEEESIPRPSLAPRKGRKHYDRVTAELIEAALLRLLPGRLS